MRSRYVKKHTSRMRPLRGLATPAAMADTAVGSEETLVSNAHMTVTVNHATGLVVYRRSSKPFLSVEEGRSAFDQVRTAARAFHKGRYVMLLDSRDAPLRNDEAFESMMQEARQDLVGFRKVALVVRSAVGMLQVNRVARQAPWPNAVEFFHDEAAALHWLNKP